MHFHWQATLPSPGLALATNLCPLLCFSSTPLHRFSAPRVKGFANFALLRSIHLSGSGQRELILCHCELLTNNPLPPSPSPPSIVFSVKRTLSPNSFYMLSCPTFLCSSSFSHFVLFQCCSHHSCLFFQSICSLTALRSADLMLQSLLISSPYLLGSWKGGAWQLQRTQCYFSLQTLKMHSLLSGVEKCSNKENPSHQLTAAKISCAQGRKENSWSYRYPHYFDELWLEFWL